MRRFIRTKDGKIFDLRNKEIDINIRYDIVFEDNTYIANDDIVKQADTFEELIEVGDLVRTSFCEEIYDIHLVEVLKDLITELYTKQGRNYVLVAEKVGGEWRVI